MMFSVSLTRKNAEVKPSFSKVYFPLTQIPHSPCLPKIFSRKPKALFFPRKKGKSLLCIIFNNDTDRSDSFCT